MTDRTHNNRQQPTEEKRTRPRHHTLPYTVDAEQPSGRQLLPPDLPVRDRLRKPLRLQLRHDLLCLTSVLIGVEDVGGAVHQTLALADA